MGLNEGYPYITVASILSFLTCSVTCIIILIYPRLRKEIQTKYTFYLALIYWVQTLVTIIPAELNDNLCSFQAFIIRGNSIAGVLWTGYIAFYLYWENVLDRIPDRLWFYTPLICIFTFCILNSIISLDVPKNYYGPGINWCWNSRTDNSATNKGYKFGLYYAIVWTVIVWQIYVFVHIRYIRMKRGANQSKITFLKYYPIILISCYVLLTIERILESSIDNAQIPTSFAIIAGVVFQLLGFFNCVAYGLNSEVKHILLKKSHREVSSSDITIKEINEENQI